jgi:hypothetical protein
LLNRMEKQVNSESQVKEPSQQIQHDDHDTNTPPPPNMAKETEEQVYLGLFIAIPVALVINAILAFVGGRWTNKLSHTTSEDVLTAHYLGGRSFGTWVTLRDWTDFIWLQLPIVDMSDDIRPFFRRATA